MASIDIVSENLWALEEKIMEGLKFIWDLYTQPRNSEERAFVRLAVKLRYASHPRCRCPAASWDLNMWLGVLDLRACMRLCGSESYEFKDSCFQMNYSACWPRMFCSHTVMRRRETSSEEAAHTHSQITAHSQAQLPVFCSELSSRL